jgi:YidC/Oxa1 family membrane protein insertase
MDRKSIIILVLCFVALFSWQWLTNKIYPPVPAPRQTTNTLATSSAGTNAIAAPGTTNAAVAPSPSLETRVDLQGLVNTNIPEQILEVTNSEAHYTFTSRGGGLKQIELVHYPETVPARRGQKVATQRLATLNSFTPVPTLALLGGESVQGDGIYSLTRTASGVRAEKQLPTGLTIVKDFTLSTNYLVMCTVRLENRSDNPLDLPAQEWFVGTATPMNSQDQGAATTVGVMWYNGSKSEDIIGSSYFSDRTFMCTPRTPPAEYRAGQSNVVWVAAHNQFFTLAAMPKDPAAQVVMRQVALPKPSLEEVQSDSRVVGNPQGYSATMVYPALSLAPKESLQRQLAVFAGPKEYRTLATVSATFDNNADQIMGFGFWGFFSKALLLGMNWLHRSMGLPYGWAIIVITVIIKLVFWPLTQASTRSAKRMAALQPQIKAIQEKHKDDPVKAQRKVMEFWKENKINPMSGCLPTLIQMPVFFGFFFMIGSAIELRGAPWLWVPDLSRPDTLFLIPILNFPFNLLPLLMGATMLWQTHLTPPSPGMDPGQAKLMKYLPLIFLVFLYTYSSGLTLYWTVQNLLSIVQTMLTRTNPEPAVATPAPVLTSQPKKRKQ